MKKSIGFVLVLVLALSLALTGCGKQNSTDLSSDEDTLYARITSVDGKTVSVEVVSVPEMPEGGNGQQTPPEMPEGGNGQQTPPEMPEGGNDQQTPPEMPESGNGQQTPPEKPEGSDGQQTPPEKPEGGDGQQTPPEMPEGSDGQQTPPEMPEGGNGQPEGLTTTGETGTITLSDTSILFISESGEESQAELSDIEEGKILKITFNESGELDKIVIFDEESLTLGGGMGGAGGQASAPTSYEAVNSYNKDAEVKGESISSTGKDENAVLVTDGKVSLSDVTVTRTSAESTGGDSSSFYGVGAAVLATGGKLDIKGGTITTDAAGGAGVFAYGNSTVSVSDTTISTKQNTSGGIHVAGGGTLYAKNLDVTTDGASAAAIRSDRGGGTMTVNGGSYTSNGTGSPAIYCTADIAVKNSKLNATNSEAICIEGKNSLHLFDCDLTGNMPDQDVNDSTWTVIVYQSMSGDAEVGSGTFQMLGGKLTSKNGGLFYTTNTTSRILLSDVEIKTSSDSEYLLACLGNDNARGWGSSGKNGADCTFTAVKQKLEGKVLWDSVSKLNFYLTDASTLNGSIIQDESHAGNGGDGYANVYISSNSKWIVDSNSTVSSLFNAGTITDSEGNSVTIVGADGTVYVKGTSSITITVNSYSDKVDLSGADTPSDASSFKFK